MKARPILMSAPMVRALLAGRKTQTRRIMKPAFGKKHPIVNLKEEGDGGREYSGKYDDPTSWGYPYAEDGNDITLSGWGWDHLLCPYGQPGDLLWVRETWALASRATDIAKIYYKAHEGASHTEFHQYVPVDKIGNYQPTWPRWKPSIHMPRWASRLTLELTDVRVERLQDISEEDAQAEGCVKGKVSGRAYESIAGLRLGGAEWANARDWYADLWESINGPDSWGANSWVWCLSFIVHQQNVDDLLKARAVC